MRRLPREIIADNEIGLRPVKLPPWQEPVNDTVPATTGQFHQPLADFTGQAPNFTRTTVRISLPTLAEINTKNCHHGWQ